MGRKWLYLAAASGALIGAAAVSFFLATGSPSAPGGGMDQQAGESMRWQRPVISEKGSLDIAVHTATLTPPADPPMPAAGAPSAPRLMTTFATAAAEDDTAGHFSAIPHILHTSLIFDDAPSGNETIILKSPPAEPEDKTFTLGKGERLRDKLVEMGVPENVAAALIKALDPVYPLRLLRAGQKFLVTLDRQQDFYGSEVIYPVYLSFAPDGGGKVVIEADEEGHFSVRAENMETARRGNAPAVQPRARPRGLAARAARAKGSGKTGKPSQPAGGEYLRARGRVSSSLYAAAKDQNVPGYIISQMLRAFSYGVDLQRQVAKGDTFDILYGPPLSGSSKRRKVLYYASLNLRGRKLTYYRFTTPRGRTAYFDENGRSAVKGLMRTPISGARITSGFGMRRHPILGYSKLHTGIDFAAARGTPIRAAGSGIVTHAGWRGGYGRTVMIRHPNGYTTLYAHQTRIARGIRKGVRVRQGQVIGYVGSTGRATGPHLHFEVRRNNKPINPRRVRTTHRIRLKGKALAAFKRHKERIRELLRQAPSPALLARR